MSKEQSQKKAATAPKQQRVSTDHNAPKEDVKKKIDKAEGLIKEVTNDNQKKGKDSNESKLEEALVILSDACNRDANMSKAFYLRAKCHYHFGDFQRALYDFSVAIRIELDNPNHKKSTIAEYQNLAGVQHYELGQLDEALKHYEQAVENDKNNGNYSYNLGLVKSRLDRVDEAIKHYSDAIPQLTEGDYQYQAYFNRGICYRRIGKLDLSIKDLNEAVKKGAEKASAFNNLALSLFEHEEFDEAITNYGKAIDKDSSSVHYNNRGLAYYHSGKLEEAKSDFDMAREKDPNDPTIYFNRGNVFLNWEPHPQFELAHKDYDTALSIAPNNAKLWHSKGLAYQGQAEFIFQTENKKEDELNQRAIEMYLQALKLQENFVSSRFHLGLMYHRTNQFQEALKCFSKVLLKISGDKTVYIARGAVYSDMGNHKLAIDDFNKAIELDEKLSEGFFRRGLSMFHSKRYQEAIEDFNKAKEIESERVSDNKLKEEEREWGIEDGLGQCQHALGNYHKALMHYETAIEHRPDNTDFMIHRAQCFFDQNQYEQSINDLLRGLKVTDKDPQLLYKLGLSYYTDAQYKQCVKYLKQALINKPFISYEADIYYHIGLAYCNLEKFEKSIFPFSRCIEMIPSDIRYIHERAKAYQMIEDHEKAVEDFNLVIKKNPKNAHAHFRRAFSHKALKNYSQAADDFEQAKSLDPLNPKMVVNYKKLKGITCIVLCKPGKEPIY